MDLLDRNLYAIECMYIHGCVFLHTLKIAMETDYYDISEHRDIYTKRLHEIGFGEYPNVMQLMDFMELFTKLVAQGVTLDAVIDDKISTQPKGFGDLVDDDMFREIPFKQLLALKKNVCKAHQNPHVSQLQDTKFPFASVISADGVILSNNWPKEPPPCKI